MTISAAHVGHLLLESAAGVPATAHNLLNTLAAAWHGLAAAATVGVAPEDHHRPPRDAFLERAAMARAAEHL